MASTSTCSTTRALMSTPHFFARVREMNPGAYLSSFVTWAPINDSILASAEADEAFSPEADDSAEGDIAVTAAVVVHLAGARSHRRAADGDEASRPRGRSRLGVGERALRLLALTPWFSALR